MLFTYTSCHRVTQHVVGIQKRVDRKVGDQETEIHWDCSLSSVIGRGSLPWNQRCSVKPNQTDLADGGWGHIEGHISRSLLCLPWKEELRLPFASQSLQLCMLCNWFYTSLRRWCAVKQWLGPFYSIVSDILICSLPCVIKISQVNEDRQDRWPQKNVQLRRGSPEVYRSAGHTPF